MECTHGVNKDSKNVKLMAQAKGIRVHRYLDDQLAWHNIQTFLALCHDLGWILNLQKSELVLIQVFDIIGYQYDLKKGWLGPHQTGLKIKGKIPSGKANFLREATNVSDRFLIRLSSYEANLVAPQKSPASSRVTGKRIHFPRSFHVHLTWCLEEFEALVYPAHSADLYKCIKQRLEHLLSELHHKRILLVPESKLNMNFLERKAVLPKRLVKRVHF